MKATLILASVSAVWVGCEIVLLFVKRSRRDEAAQKDRGSFTVLWTTIAVSCFLAGMATNVRSALMPADLRRYAFVAGIALIVIGFAIRLTAIFTLRRYFTVDVAIAKDHKVIDKGVYGMVRHPSYTGSFLSFLGLGLAFGNWLSLAIVMLGPLVAFGYRIKVEEQALMEALGEDYRAYAARTKRFIPRLF